MDNKDRSILVDTLDSVNMAFESLEMYSNQKQNSIRQARVKLNEVHRILEELIEKEN